MTETSSDTETPPAVGTVDGYRLVVPEEWRKIPVRHGTDRAVKALLDEAFASHGRDQVAQYRREAEARLRQVIVQARMNAGVDLFLPLGHRQHNLPASFIISYISFDRTAAADPQSVLSQVLAQTEGARSVELGGTHSIRTEREYGPDRSRDVDYPSRRVEYILPVPNRSDSWLLSSFSTFGDGKSDDNMARLLCTLFDAIMTTFRWNYRQEEE